MNELIPLAFESQPFKVMDKDGNPWFVAKDICDILGIKQPTRAVKNFPESEITTCEVNSNHPTSVKARKSQRMIIVNLSDLFRLIFKSTKPEAERFKDFILKYVVSNTFKIWKNPKFLPLPGSLQGGCYTINGEPVYAYNGNIYNTKAEMQNAMVFDGVFAANPVVSHAHWSVSNRKRR